MSIASLLVSFCLVQAPLSPQQQEAEQQPAVEPAGPQPELEPQLEVEPEPQPDGEPQPDHHVTEDPGRLPRRRQRRRCERWSLTPPGLDLQPNACP